MTAAADLFRYHPSRSGCSSSGWAASAATGARLLLRSRAAAGRLRAGLVLAGLALLTHLPQFFPAPAGRIGHGVVLAAGLLLPRSRSRDQAHPAALR